MPRGICVLILPLVKRLCDLDQHILLQRAYRRYMLKISLLQHIPFARCALHVPAFAPRLDENMAVLLHRQLAVAGHTAPIPRSRTPSPHPVEDVLASARTLLDNETIPNVARHFFEPRREPASAVVKVQQFEIAADLAADDPNASSVPEVDLQFAVGHDSFGKRLPSTCRTFIRRSWNDRKPRVSIRRGCNE